ncbi:long-chain-fatty-acid--CoA ligase [Kribbia dieselivorans]|uniref:long-chain-fatty-acid--CoA ligase n=1 Tax=Kribbia dieselivorans TaxID=331526 RepID=UPI00083907FE|nr:long-chain-fatty-acid--CoA ligase [Kribbia dieselivorans]
MQPVSFTALTPLSFLRRSASVWPQSTAIVYGDRRHTYAQFQAEAVRVAHALKHAGVKPGDRVAYLMPNVPEMVVAEFAVPLAGGVLLAMNTRLAPPEIGYILQHSEAKVLIVDAGFATAAIEGVQDANLSIPVVVVDDTVAGITATDAHREALGGFFRTYDEFLATGSDEPLPFEIDDELAPLALNYTSGTTGRPKGVVYTHRGAHLNALSEIIHSGFTRASNYLWTLPLFHCNGWCTGWAVTAVGGTQVCLREVRGTAIWDNIRTHEITHLNGAPTVVTTILNAEEAGRLESPITITTAGAPPAPATIMEMADMGFTINHVYGLTESYGPYSVCEPQDSWTEMSREDRAVAQARQGVGMIHADRLRVVDGQMGDVPADGTTMGEIVMRGNGIMKGYFKDDAGTAAAFQGGWFHTGDLGVMHPDGYVELRDRMKDVVISGGENISTVEVEQALMSHPDVLEAAVIGVPDPKWGERPKGFVIVKPDATITGEELVEHVKTRIARYKAPGSVDVVPDLPKTSTGKIQKFALREQAWAGHESRIQG